MGKEVMILGDGCSFSTDSRETGLNNNVIVCGCSGSGKTMSISEPHLLETKDSSLVAAVTKRRIVNQYMPLFQERGYDVLDLNYVNPEKSNCSYDPLDYINSYADITFLAKAIVKSDPQKDHTDADPYWDESAVSLLSAEIAYTMMTVKNAGFTNVIRLHNQLEIVGGYDSVRTSLDSEFESLSYKDPFCFAVSCWKTFKNLPLKTAGCVYGTLNTMIDKIFSPEITEMMQIKKSIDIEQVAQKKTILFLTTSAVNPTLHCFINIFYGQLFKTLFEYAESRIDGVLPIPVHILCDDFATGSRILDFPEYISIFREKKISVTLLLQSESQLEAMYGSQNATTIINNCDTYIYMGGMDLKTAESISLRLNVPLDEVLYMPVGQLVIFRRGQQPIITTRYDIRKNALYQKILNDYEKKIASSER